MLDGGLAGGGDMPPMPYHLQGLWWPGVSGLPLTHSVLGLK